MRNGAKLAAATTGQGNAGNIIVNAQNTVALAGADIVSAMEEGVGTGGNIGIKADSISLRQGATITASTFAVGDAGNVTLTAKNVVSLADPNTTIFSSVEPGSIGNGGKISIDAKSIALTNGAQLNAANNGTGNAGSVAITATDLVSLSGANTIVFSTIEAGGVGNGGKISIAAGDVALSDGAQLRSLSRGKGDAGDVSITSRQAVTLTGQRTAIFNTIDTSGAGKGGNITVDAGSVQLSNGSLLLLRNGAQIATDAAGTAQQGGNGGNINVNAQFIVAVPTENSDITANAVKGSGGNVNINAQGVFGTQLRSRQTSNSDITASSDLGRSGNIVINTPGIDPGKNLGELPVVPTDATKQISQTCRIIDSTSLATADTRQLLTIC